MNCNICQSKAKLVLPMLEGFKAGQFYDIYECQGCGSSFCSPNEADSELYKEIYRHGETIAGYNRYHGYFRAVKSLADPLNFLAHREDCYWFINDYLQNNINKHEEKLLEVGSGLGYLTYSLHKAGYDIRGVELSSVAVAEAVDQFGDLYQCRNALELVDEGEHFDVILLTEVIEHLSDPVTFIKQLSALLTPDGVILVTTPNKEYAPNKASEWASDLPPVHLWWLTKQGFRVIADKTDLAVNFHSFRAWNRLNFSRALIGKPERIVNLPRLSADGEPIKPERNVLKPRGFIKKLKSVIRYSLYSSGVNVDDGAIIGAVFYNR